MSVKDYHDILVEIADIDIEVSSIADSRRLLAELNEKEEALIQLKKSVIVDMRSIESDHLKKKRMIMDKYQQQNSGIIGVFRGSNKSRRIKALKRQDTDNQGEIESYSEIKCMIDDLMGQLDNIKGSMNDFIKEKLG
ncbi:hypothetical protein [Methanobacterium paludis]|uniref:Uncharacterized protein n=1 Tax=Methanobacterium paludis (strain DSM 25820 / JCM 18151 / SWAN1) TaxID=868131 RepID=F6D6U7_METPW|nr:hypothetical protein [Methanobacterium paludis]AEG18985.1 hypothetical protein MSWAN_1976 [Methanobacterium paludis]